MGKKAFGPLAALTCWDPCCRREHLAAALRDHFASIRVSDAGSLEQDARDFLKGRIKRDAVDWIITQPPRGKIELVILRALQTASRGVAVLIHTPAHGSPGPRLKVFEKHTPAVVAPLGSTVPLLKADPSDPLEQTASFTWLVWFKGETGPSKLVILPGPDFTRHEMH